MDFNPPVRLDIEVDEEGVVRVTKCSVKRFEVTPEDLGALLTALLKAVTGAEDTDQEINVSLN